MAQRTSQRLEEPSLHSSAAHSMAWILGLGLAACLLVAGLFLAADRLGARQEQAASEPAKIGPLLTRKGQLYASQPAQAAESAAPAAPPPAAQPVQAALQAQPALAVHSDAPAITASAAETTPPPAAQPVSMGDRFPKGAAGCTQYRTYDATTQTYRGFDGRVHECKPAAR